MLIVGTTSAVQTAVNKHAQLRSLFGTTVLEPLLAADVHRLLRERYLFLRLDSARPAGRPVTVIHRGHPEPPQFPRSIGERMGRGACGQKESDESEEAFHAA